MIKYECDTCKFIMDSVSLYAEHKETCRYSRQIRKHCEGLRRFLSQSELPKWDRDKHLFIVKPDDLQNLVNRCKSFIKFTEENPI